MLKGLFLALLLSAQPALARSNDSVYLEDLTWTELAARTAAGSTTVIIPVGGIEQSGPAVALGKHDARVRELAGRIARALGNAVVAPVVSYVPEGDISPPTQHMRFPGTITVPPAVFRATLESAAMSLGSHGFRTIVLIGDHGGYQGDLKLTAEALNHRWAGSSLRAAYIPQYYTATQTAYVAELERQKFTLAEIGSHAGLADTSLTLAIAPGLVRQDVLAAGARLTARYGVYGDPRRASAALGRPGVEAIIAQTVAAIRSDEARHSPAAIARPASR